MILEARGDKIVGTSPINKLASTAVLKFITFMNYVVMYADKESATPADLQSLKDFVDSHKEGYSTPIKRKLEPLYQQWKDRESVVPVMDKITADIVQISDKYIDLLRKGDLGALFAFDKSSNANGLIEKYHAGTVDVSLKMDNPYVIQPAFILQRSGFYDSLSHEKIKQVISKDITMENKTYLRFSTHMLDDYELMLHYVSTLTNQDVVQLSMGDYKTYIAYSYMGDPMYKSLVSAVDNYLVDNNKVALDTIINLLPAFPELQKLNNYYKSKNRVAFRGLGFNYVMGERTPSIKDIINRDKENRYVATSHSKAVARRFAKGRGHLMYDPNNDRDVQVVLTYDISDPSSVVLDSRAIGGVYQESEVIIDTRYARFIEHEIEYKDE